MARRRHPCYKFGAKSRELWICSKIVKDRDGKFEPLPRQDEPGHWCHYNHYRVLRTHAPWRVPILYGQLPHKPDGTSGPEERGRYAVCMMLLFRPWRDPVADVRGWAGAALHGGDISKVWDALFHEFLRWRAHDIIVPALPYFDRAAPPSSIPRYDSEAWWLCMLFQRLLNMELALSRKRMIQPTPLTSLLGLPVEEIDTCDVDADEADLSGDEASVNGNLDGLVGQRQDISLEETLHKSTQPYPPVFCFFLREVAAPVLIG